MMSKSDVGTYTYAPPGSPLPHAVMSISGPTLSTTFTYDVIGNQTSGLGRTITWTSYNMPASITQGARTVSFQHDDKHQRIKQVSTDGTTLYIKAFGVTAELFGVGTPAARWNDYLSVGNVQVGMRVTEIAAQTVSTRYFQTDHLGSVTVITNESAVVVERLSFDAWGKRRYPNGTDDPTGVISSQTNRGFTGHEELDAVALVHMNGRVYDPLVGRMISADPTVPDPMNAQAWNRYSYVGNDPLAFTDPSGYSWLSSFFRSVANFFTNNPIVRSIVQIAITVVLTAAIAIPVIGPVIAAAAGASIVTGLSGGNLGQMLRAGAIAGATAFAFNIVGDITGHTPSFGTPAHAANVAGHALVGCSSSAASGGSCQSGALSGAAGSALSPLTRQLFPNARTDLGERVGGTIVQATAGGIASVAGGGSFANGAVTAAFGYLFNDLICDAGSCYGKRPTKSEIDAHYRDGTGWPVYAGSMDPSWLDSSQFDAIPIGGSGGIFTSWPSEVALDAYRPSRNVGDRNIYGDFTATRVDADHFLWNDRYNFNIQPGVSVRNAATMWGGLVAGRGGGGVGFSITGISPVRIPGR